MNLWLIGTGPHAVDYAKVLDQLNLKYLVIGRGAKSAKNFSLESGKTVLPLGLNNAIKQLGPPSEAIIAVSFDQLAYVAIELIKAGTRRILIEKPGGLNKQEILQISASAALHKAEIWVGYNRRFYASTLGALNRINEDGGPVSCVFEFTEWPQKIVPWAVSSSVKEALVIANSSHVIDLAFYICGRPKDWRGWHSGMLPWHSSAARFCGAGVTEQGVLFSYNADWEAPGRWSIEILTRKRRYIFKPMEQLHVIEMGSNFVDKVVLEDTFDQNFKPGLYRQTQAFIYGDCESLCTINDQVKLISIYSDMAGYT